MELIFDGPPLLGHFVPKVEQASLLDEGREICAAT